MLLYIIYLQKHIKTQCRSCCRLKLNYVIEPILPEPLSGNGGKHVQGRVCVEPEIKPVVKDGDLLYSMSTRQRILNGPFCERNKIII